MIAWLRLIGTRMPQRKVGRIAAVRDDADPLQRTNISSADRRAGGRYPSNRRGCLIWRAECMDTVRRGPVPG
jgi:hypothetical protein